MSTYVAHHYLIEVSIATLKFLNLNVSKLFYINVYFELNIGFYAIIKFLTLRITRH